SKVLVFRTREMLTPRTTLTRAVAAAIDAVPSRIPVLVGGCGTGRTTLLHQVRDRVGRFISQYVDVERSATTPERFLKALCSSSPFVPVADAPGARPSFDAALAFFTNTRGPGGEPVTFLL